MVVASGKGGVGKSNLAANLAVALGERGARVLLVDADLSQANLDILLGVHPPRLPGGRIVEWCRRFGIAEGTARVALSRMVDRGELTNHDGVYELAGPFGFGWSLLGHPIDDDAMVDLLEPLRPHRHRAVRLLEVSGMAHNPRFGARRAIPNLRAI